MSNQIVSGSIAAVANATHKSIAEHMLNVDHIVIVDTSGSMSINDSRGGRSRFDVAREELARLQSELPGRIAVVAFSDTAQFVPGGVPPFLAGGTNLAGALRYVRNFDGVGATFTVVSDGQPDDAQAALKEARGFTSKVNCVYVGPEDHPTGRDFLRRLAAAAGGQHATADRVMHLADTMRPMLTAGGTNHA